MTDGARICKEIVCEVPSMANFGKPSFKPQANLAESGTRTRRPPWGKGDTDDRLHDRAGSIDQGLVLRISG
ncbi:hypothetical protein HPP92_005622 [Vanilla planifolia]|uniref:Uncharacterized protein n=1 Tax=Vanilla planifolia TaxID=51239 RepID=A0A835RZ57_VANPL|nr:hypothetical protein HPP92_005622 [Vanilla planifolia]